MEPSGAPDRSDEHVPGTTPLRAPASPFSADRLHNSLPHQSHDLLCTHDLSGRILSIHSFQPLVLGYTVEELLQLRLPGLLAPEYRPRFDDYLGIIQKHQTASGLTTLLAKS